MKTSIVTTTINIPRLLVNYARNARFYGHADVDFIVVGDRKSPSGTAEFCDGIARDFYPCTYLDIERQKQYLERFPDLWQHLLFDSIQRRNIGLLMAWEQGADVIITIDDDNFVMNHDYVGRHSIAGSVRDLLAYSSTSGFFNVCSCLEEQNGISFHHRGYPMKQRWTESTQFVTSSQVTRRVCVNAGFWLDDPDIDALTRMNRPLVVRGYRKPWSGNFALQPGTWSPFNSQNTALMRDAVPAYFLSPYIGRYDDIWASYVINRAAEQLGDVVSFGEPFVRQERNPHDLWKDLDAERNGMILTDEFCAALREIPLTGSTYHACFGEITHRLASTWQETSSWSDSLKSWRRSLITGFAIWHDVFDKITTSQ